MGDHRSMTNPGNLPYLLISLSEEPDSTWRRPISADVMCLGRPETDASELDTIDLRTD